MSKHTRAGASSIPSAIVYYLQQQAAGAPHEEAIQPLLDELSLVQHEIDFCCKFDDYVRHFWNEASSPGGPGLEDISWPDLNDVAEAFNELVDAVDSDLEARRTFIRSLTDGRRQTSEFADLLADCKTKYSAVLAALPRLSDFFRDNLAKALDSDEARWRFYYFLRAEINAVQSSCSDAQASLTSLARAMIRLMRSEQDAS